MRVFSRNEVKAIEKGYYVDKDGNAKRHGSNAILGTNGIRKYRYIGIKIDGKNIKAYIHRLQAYQKFGDKIYETGIEVRHLDGNMFNNSFDNIEIGTSQENSLDKPAHVRLRAAKKASKAACKFSLETVMEIRELHRQGKGYKELMKMFGISSKGTISHLINKRII